MPKHSTPESVLLSEVLLWLSCHRVFHWRNNTGAMKIGKRFVRFGVAGLPDVLAVLGPSGRIIGIECKSGRGRLTVEQQAVRDNLTEAGGVYLVVRNLQDLETGLRDAGWEEQ